ncbi:MAG TPA: sigma-70 family RNA polymerase sigma factor [Vicinamibacterales bacterium]|nr:sigma-70 family RNA polymerase sigma factor [Vicinamibacterales bacterium]
MRPLTTRDYRPVVAAARAGDEDAFAELYRVFGRAVHGTLLARLPASDAADLVQDVFIQAWSRLRELRDDSAFGAWICTIARRQAASHYRSRREFVSLPANLAAREGTHVQAEAHAAVAAIQDLPEAYRETLTLRLVEGLTGSEIASVTGLTPDSVRVNLHRGFTMLRARLGVTS